MSQLGPLAKINWESSNLTHNYAFVLFYVIKCVFIKCLHISSA